MGLGNIIPPALASNRSRLSEPEYAPFLNLGMRYVTDFKNVYPEIAINHDLTFIPFFLEGVAGDPTLNIADGIHPNRAGYEIVVNQNIWPSIEPLLD